MGLYQHAAGNLFVFKAVNKFRFTKPKDAKALLRFQNFNRSIIIIGRHDYFRKNLCYCARRSLVKRSIESHDAAESRKQIARQRASVGFLDSNAQRNARGICVFDYGAGRRLELAYKLPRRVGIDVVVERHFLSGKLFSRCQPRRFNGRGTRSNFIESGGLMRVFTVTKVSRLV